MTRQNQTLTGADHPFLSSPTRIPTSVPSPPSPPINTITASESTGDPSTIKTRPQFKWIPTDANVHNQYEHPYVQRRPKSPSPRSSPMQTSSALPHSLSIVGGLSAPTQSHLPATNSSSAWPLDAKMDLDRLHGISAASRICTHADSRGPSSVSVKCPHNTHHEPPIFFRPPTPSIASSSRRYSSSSSEYYLPNHDQYYPDVGSVPMVIDHQRYYAARTRAPGCCLSLSIPAKVRPWLPMATWFATTIGFLIAIAFWRTEVFQGLDDLATYLKEEGYYGHAILFLLILITTFPPLPLYSTFMMLAGYAFGPITGFYISYTSSLIGACIVFLIFRHFIPTRLTASILPPSLKRVVRAIEERPSIFLLVRVAPYPYNVLNAVLGSSSNMTLGMYLCTTSISLFKVIVHTTIGGEIKSFKDYHTDEKEGGKKEWTWKEAWTVFGIILCVGLFVYLSIVARRAVDELEVHHGLLPSHSPPGYPSCGVEGGEGEGGNVGAGPAMMRSVSPSVGVSSWGVPLKHHQRGYERVSTTETPYGGDASLLPSSPSPLPTAEPNILGVFLNEGTHSSAGPTAAVGVSLQPMHPLGLKKW